MVCLTFVTFISKSRRSHFSLQEEMQFITIYVVKIEVLQNLTTRGLCKSHVNLCGLSLAKLQDLLPSPFFLLPFLFLVKGIHQDS